MEDNIQLWRRAEKLPEVINNRRTALGRGLGALLLRGPARAVTTARRCSSGAR